ncbi:MAG: hypothetical protein JSU59_01195 [Nitrospirota bacterium]|nr:MAG: hypothetical protein JSU59_01195 [Nitrospirota bacterium]
MYHSYRWMVILLIVAGLLLSGCQRSSTHHAMNPAEVKHIEGSDLSLVILTEKAAQRIDLKTDKVREMKVKRSESERKVVPYSSLIYDRNGQTWIYKSPKPLTFVRHKVEVDYIEGKMAVLNDGPPTDTIVASLGVAEIYGTETGVGH